MRPPPPNTIVCATSRLRILSNVYSQPPCGLGCRCILLKTLFSPLETCCGPQPSALFRSVRGPWRQNISVMSCASHIPRSLRPHHDTASRWTARAQGPRQSVFRNLQALHGCRVNASPYRRSEDIKQAGLVYALEIMASKSLYKMDMMSSRGFKMFPSSIIQRKKPSRLLPSLVYIQSDSISSTSWSRLSSQFLELYLEEVGNRLFSFTAPNPFPGFPSWEDPLRMFFFSFFLRAFDSKRSHVSGDSTTTQHSADPPPSNTNITPSHPGTKNLNSQILPDTSTAGGAFPIGNTSTQFTACPQPNLIEPSRPKTLVWACDGTGQKGTANDGVAKSNVFKLCQMLKGASRVDDPSHKVVVIYHDGPAADMQSSSKADKMKNIEKAMLGSGKPHSVLPLAKNTALPSNITLLFPARSTSCAILFSQTVQVDGT